MSQKKYENLVNLIKIARQNLETYTDEERDKLLLSFKKDLEEINKNSNEDSSNIKSYLRFFTE
ncbi:hypothetical protein BWK59_11720 [Flavobacterium davisii]|uniref:Uncharacterized protein n=1 Tax=Flavobacterium davisii TaxID=2906077 RepID=A0A246GGC0_9FLAO|nr:hypothetical protein [Flavobacterium davisii]OWP83209.1 hypothetical protein BWK59_11720 [Flavobacterium davisii]